MKRVILIFLVLAIGCVAASAQQVQLNLADVSGRFLVQRAEGIENVNVVEFSAKGTIIKVSTSSHDLVWTKVPNRKDLYSYGTDEKDFDTVKLLYFTESGNYFIAFYDNPEDKNAYLAILIGAKL